MDEGLDSLLIYGQDDCSSSSASSSSPSSRPHRAVLRQALQSGDIDGQSGHESVVYQLRRCLILISFTYAHRSRASRCALLT